MQKIRYRLVYNRTKKLNNQGQALVQVEASLNGKKMYATTRIYLRPEEWDSNRAQVAECHSNHKSLNAYLFEFIFNMEKVEMDLWRRGMIPTLQQLKDYVTGEKNEGMSFDSFAHMVIEQSDRKKGSKSNLLVTLKQLKQYKPGYDWNDITYSFLKGFEEWLRTKGNSVNTIGKHLANLRTLMNEGIRHGYISSSPFSSYKIRQERGKHTFLTIEELEKLENLKVRDGLRHTLDAFLFCCYVGLRYSDLRQMKQEHIVMKGGYPWLVLKTQKTGSALELPLWLMGNGRALRILDSYRSIEEFAGIGCNPDVNRKLKEITQLSGIRKRITFHAARHTCATTLVYYGTPITTVSKVLGHSKISTTQIYSEVHQQTLLKDLSSVACMSR